MNVLVIFARQPIAGAVKTRLAEAIGLKRAADAYAAFLGDLLERFTALADQRVVAFTPTEAAGYFEAISPDSYGVAPQGEGGLGERMQRVFARYLAQAQATGDNAGPRVVLIGSDSPTLPRRRVNRAFRLLADHDVVLGPATDGGYYLIGCRRLVPELFDGVAWGTADVLLQTVARLPARSVSVALLDPWYDVDTIASWQMLRGHVAALRRAGVDPGVPHTEAILRALDELHGGEG